MPMKPFLAGLILFMHVAGASAAAPLPDPILLWPEGAPGATGSSPEDKPAITAFLPDEKSRNGTAILVVPGGGYTIRAVDHEGVLAAQWLRDHGYAAFLLRYRLNRYTSAITGWRMENVPCATFARMHGTTGLILPGLARWGSRPAPICWWI